MNKLNCDFIFSRFLGVEEFVILGFLVAVFFTILYFKFIQRSRAGDTGLIIFLVGTGGNLVERISFGCVGDHINFFGIFYFNVWDLLVSLGIILIGWAIWKRK
jgi:lipoprotein signal peptidase